jgi:hypothetical protein
MLNQMENKLPDPEFHLRVKVVVKFIEYQDTQSKGTSNAQADMVFLVPQESAQRDIFFAKYLPDISGEAVELPSIIPYPVSGLARVALMRRDRRCDEHYLFVMSRGAEEDLKECRDRVIDLQILSENDDNVLDFQKDYVLPDQKKFDILT